MSLKDACIEFSLVIIYLLEIKARRRKVSWYDKTRLEEFERITNSKLEAIDTKIFASDFYNILSSDKKERGREFDHNRASKFRRFVNNCEIVDVKANGSFFTWRNDLENKDFIQERLDRMLINKVVLVKYPNIEVFVSPISSSDDNMLVLSLDSNIVNGKKRFKYGKRMRGTMRL